MVVIPSSAAAPALLGFLLFAAESSAAEIATRRARIRGLWQGSDPSTGAPGWPVAYRSTGPDNRVASETNGEFSSGETA